MNNPTKRLRKVRPNDLRIPSTTKRDEASIRASLYLKLGLLEQTPQHRAALNKRQTTNTPPQLTSCLRKRAWSAIHASEKKNVTFYERVRVRTIPSHREFDPETRDRLFYDPYVFEAEMNRNKFEFWTDGRNWRRASEEKDFHEAEDGSLVHPASWSLMANLACQFRQTCRRCDSEEEDFEADDQPTCPYQKESYNYGIPEQCEPTHPTPLCVIPVQASLRYIKRKL